MKIHSYESAHTFLGSKQDRPLPGRFTRLQKRDNGAIAVRYHVTDVVTYRPDGTIVLRSGGWQSPTTKNRINNYTGARLTQRAGQWRFTDGSLFSEGAIVTAAGVPLTPIQETPSMATVKRQLDAAVSRTHHSAQALLPAVACAMVV